MNRIFRLLVKLRIWDINPIKTLYFNFHYFPFKQAIQLPCLVYRRTYLKVMRGGVQFDKIRPGLLKLGLKGPETLDTKYDRTIWVNRGSILFHGRTIFSGGCKINVDCNGTLTLGDNFVVNGNSKIICEKAVTFENDCLLSWDVTVMDTDFHSIIDSYGCAVNPPSAVHIGKHVWMGFGVTVLKGVSIAKHTVIAANSTITKNCKESNVVLGGNGGRQYIIKENVTWSRENPAAHLG